MLSIGDSVLVVNDVLEKIKEVLDLPLNVKFYTLHKPTKKQDKLVFERGFFIRSTSDEKKIGGSVKINRRSGKVSFLLDDQSYGDFTEFSKVIENQVWNEWGEVRKVEIKDKSVNFLMVS